MKITTSSCFLPAALLAAAGLLAPAHGSMIIVDDSFADGDTADTPGDPLDTDWWTSSSSSGIEVSTGSLGLVTGSSGRGIHTIFDSVALGVGDSIKATFTFTTPATVGSNRTSSFRVGFFDDLGRADLDDNVSASSSSPNDVYGFEIPFFGGVPGLPGYMADVDMNLTDPADADINFREHNIAPTSNPSGRLMATTSNFISVDDGDDTDPEGYTFSPNTEYVGMYEILRQTATDTVLSYSLSDPTGVIASFSATDDSGTLENVAMLGFHANSNTFGSSSSAGDPDNGIDFSNIRIEFTPIPEPTSAALLAAAVLAAGVRVRR